MDHHGAVSYTMITDVALARAISGDLAHDRARSAEFCAATSARCNSGKALSAVAQSAAGCNRVLPGIPRHDLDVSPAVAEPLVKLLPIKHDSLSDLGWPDHRPRRAVAQPDG
jgi:hypothetical protein